MFLLDGDEQALEVSCSETEVVSSLNDFVEQSGSVFDWLGEDLEQVTFVVVVDKDLVLLEDVDVLSYLNAHVWKVLPQNVIVSIWDSQKLNASASEVLYCFDDGFGFKGNMLNTRTVVVIDVLLNLRLLLSDGWLVDWHFNVLVIVSNDDGSQSRVLSVHHFIID